MRRKSVRVAGKQYQLGPDIDLDKEVVLDNKGKRITEARAQALAEETLNNIRRGRPSLSGAAHHSPKVSFRVSSETAHRAEEVAAQQGKSLSQLGREALEEYLARVK